MTWKFLISAILIVGTGYAAFDVLQLGIFNLPELPLGAYPIPFSNGVKEALIDMPEESNRKLAKAYTWLRASPIDVASLGLVKATLSR